MMLENGTVIDSDGEMITNFDMLGLNPQLKRPFGAS
jgi:hypothetical protein